MSLLEIDCSLTVSPHNLTNDGCNNAIVEYLTTILSIHGLNVASDCLRGLSPGNAATCSICYVLINSLF